MIQRNQIWKVGKQHIEVVKIDDETVYFKVVNGAFLGWDVSVSLSEFQDMICKKHAIQK